MGQIQDSIGKTEREESNDYSTEIKSLKEELMSINDTVKKLEVILRISQYEHLLGNDYEALKLAGRVYYSLRSNRILKSKAALSIRNFYFELGDYNEALKYHNRTDFSLIDDWETLVPNHFLSLVYYKLGDYKKSIDILEESVSVMRKSQRPYWEMSLTNSLGVIYKEAGLLDSAWAKFNRAKVVFNTNFTDTSDVEFEFINGLIYGNLAQVLTLQNEHLRAIPLYKLDIESSLTEPAKPNKIRNACISMMELTTSFIATNQLSEARKQIQKIKPLLSQHDWPEQNLSFWKLKAELCEALGDNEMALQASKKYIRLRDSLDHVERNELFKNLKAIYSIGVEHTRENDESNAIQALNKELTVATWTRNLALVLIMLLLTMLLFMYWFNIKNEPNKSIDLKDQFNEQTVAIEKALKEKDMLLREVHHRVKNNLQIISSLFFLQSKNIQDEVALGLIKEGQSRIHVMSLIHQKLYQAEALNHIDFQNYFSDLTKQILQMHQSKDVEIDVIIDAHEISDTMELAVPLGMIANELLTNSIKHAFVGRRLGHIHIGLTKHLGRMKLIYEDDGRGFTDNDDFITGSSLGMKLIRLLTNQLGGNLEFGPTEGFNLSIEFDHT